MRKALQAYWTDEAHATLLEEAKSSAHISVLRIGQWQRQIGVFDYKSFVKTNPALAGIFLKNHFLPAQFEPTMVAVVQAIGYLSPAADTTIPPLTTAAGRNVAVVKAQQTALATVGISIESLGGNVSGNDLNP